MMVMMTHVVAARRQVQVEAGGCRVLAAAGLGAGGVAAGAAVGLLGRQAHRRLRRVHGPRADERALHPAQLHAPFGVPTQMRAISMAGAMSDPSREASSVCPSTLYRYFLSSFAPYFRPWDLSSVSLRALLAFQDISNNSSGSSSNNYYYHCYGDNNNNQISQAFPAEIWTFPPNSGTPPSERLASREFAKSEDPIPPGHTYLGV